MFLTSPVLFAVSTVLALSCVIASPFVVPREYNDGIHLAVSPNCGPLGGNTADVNAGIDLSKIKTIVSFGARITAFHSIYLPVLIMSLIYYRTPIQMVRPFMTSFHAISS